jgi:hypothetical protein
MLKFELIAKFKQYIGKTGPLTASALMFMAVVLLVWLMHTTYVSLINYDKSLLKLISGKVFVYSFQYPADPIKAWYAAITFFVVILLPYTTIARYISHRKTCLAYWSFVIPTIALYLYLLIILTVPFSWLIQYLNTMGVTPIRICGLFYGLAGYVVILTFLYWAVKRPKDYMIPSS